MKAQCFYVGKTQFIKEWWESGDSVTLITHPRRFGKTLNLSMLDCFFSVKYENRADLLRTPVYELTLTNHEVRLMFYGMIHGWFARTEADYDDFVKALLRMVD